MVTIFPKRLNVVSIKKCMASPTTWQFSSQHNLYNHPSFLLIDFKCTIIYILYSRIVWRLFIEFWLWSMHLFLLLLLACLIVCNSFATPWTVKCQALLPMGFSRQEYWSRLLSASPENLPYPGIEPTSPASLLHFKQIFYCWRFFTTGEAHSSLYCSLISDGDIPPLPFHYRLFIRKLLADHADLIFHVAFKARLIVSSPVHKILFLFLFLCIYRWTYREMAFLLFWILLCRMWYTLYFLCHLWVLE